MDDVKSLTHTKWNCKHHIVFAPKYRRKVFYEEKRLEIGAILRELCRWKGVEIMEAEVCPDHIHMLISIPPKMSVSGFMGFLKGKSSLMIYQKWGNMKFKYRNRQFWCRGYYVDTVTYFYGHFLRVWMGNFLIDTISYHFPLSDLIHLCNQDMLAPLRREFLPDTFYILTLPYPLPARG